jgi:hypothetical protein
VASDDALRRREADPRPRELALVVQAPESRESLVGVRHIEPGAIVADHERRRAGAGECPISTRGAVTLPVNFHTFPIRFSRRICASAGFEQRSDELRSQFGA